MEKYRVRYSRLNNRQPKNTLVTIRDGDMVHFGIARCNDKMDLFIKSVGRHIAKERANLASSEAKNNLEGVHNSGLRGSVPLNKISGLLDYFQNIDTVILSKQLSYRG